MTVTIELPPEVEAGLAALAAARGIPLQQYVRGLLENQLPVHDGATRTPAERAAYWRESATGLPRTPPLSDEAISRDSIYDARG